MSERTLTPDAKRALEEAEARREKATPLPKEVGGTAGPDRRGSGIGRRRGLPVIFSDGPHNH